MGYPLSHLVASGDTFIVSLKYNQNLDKGHSRKNYSFTIVFKLLYFVMKCACFVLLFENVASLLISMIM